MIVVGGFSAVKSDGPDVKLYDQTGCVDLDF
jgi:hypothetical protein